MQAFGLNPLVAINHFPGDSQEEINLVQDLCAKYNTQAIVAKGFADGGKGMAKLATALVQKIEENQGDFKPLYDYSLSIEEKINTIATKIYGADGVEYSVKAKNQLKNIKDLGFDNFPVCMAKTPKSLSDDDTKLARPSNFIVKVREFEFASGAGFIIPILGEIMRMPGLPSIPAAENMDIDANGKITGLS